VIVDTSALVAIIQCEPEAERFLEVLAKADQSAISAVSLVEAGMVLSDRKDRPMQANIEHLLRRLGTESVSFTDEHRIEALNAHWRYGKGRHRAALNLGDCVACATARVAGQPLLFKGDDFSLTDIDSVEL